MQRVHDEAVLYTGLAVRAEMHGDVEGAWSLGPGGDRSDEMATFLGHRNRAVPHGLSAGDADCAHSCAGDRGWGTADGIVADMRVPERRVGRLSAVPAGWPGAVAYPVGRIRGDERNHGMPGRATSRDAAQARRVAEQAGVHVKLRAKDDGANGPLLYPAR